MLGLPYAMSYLGWAGGTVTLVLSWVSEPPHLGLVLLLKHSLLDIHCPLSDCLHACSRRGTALLVAEALLLHHSAPETSISTLAWFGSIL